MESRATMAVNLDVFVGQQPSARSVGTTVAVKDLFKTLPVRYKTFQRNIKREFVKLVQVLQAYALIACGVKMVATNQARFYPEIANA
jgi:DNA mismatch repair protein PMS2